LSKTGRYWGLYSWLTRDHKEYKSNRPQNFKLPKSKSIIRRTGLYYQLRYKMMKISEKEESVILGISAENNAQQGKL
jgi:hypothetical protein